MDTSRQEIRDRLASIARTHLADVPDEKKDAIIRALMDTNVLSYVQSEGLTDSDVKEALETLVSGFALLKVEPTSLADASTVLLGQDPTIRTSIGERAWGLVKRIIDLIRDPDHKAK